MEMTITDSTALNGVITANCSLSDMKRLYRALFAQLKAGGKLNDDGDLAMTLQQFLQRKAHGLGVDVTDHSAWEAWLAED
jgi:hypothetical protein